MTLRNKAVLHEMTLLTKLTVSKAAAPEIIGGLAMIPIPSRVTSALRTGTNPNFSPRKK